MRSRRLVRPHPDTDLVGLMVVALLLAGCASRPDPLPTQAAETLPWGAVGGLDQPLEADTILVLSGGGANGAYGAGLLYGWSERGDRPEFDVVTGVSTGSLIAPMAFLGYEYDGRLRQFYTDLEEAQIFRSRYWVEAPFSESLMSAAPLDALLVEFITPEIVEAIGVEHRKGRRLYAGTTNLDARLFTVWDLGAVAASDREDKVAYFRKILRASASIPLAFEPIYFDVDHKGKTYGQMHVDGGIVGPIFVQEWMLKPAIRGAAPSSRQVAQGNGDIYVILNLPLRATEYDAVDPGIVAIAEASLTMVNDAFNLARLTTAHDLAGQHDYRFHYTAIPAALSGPDGALRFEREFLTDLFEKGRAAIKQETVWRTDFDP